MAAAGSDVAIETTHVALLADDWTLVPEIFQIAQHPSIHASSENESRFYQPCSTG